MNICLVSANDVMEHFAFPGNIDFAADDQGEQRRQRRQQETEEQRNRRLEYQRQCDQGRATLYLNNVSNLCNSGPLSNETAERQECRLQGLRTAQARRLANETDKQRNQRLQTLRQNNSIEFTTKPTKLCGST